MKPSELAAPPFFRKITPDAAIRAYNIAHTPEMIHPGGVRGDLLSDLYHADLPLFILYWHYNKMWIVA
jgi:hypothetical protein